mmetsp:Transcript_65882/g.77411  ORF Transcript_65882/g.77411 Transcript_65882/m.77411 type:complete len:202 (-) Transcript_65882:1869-2474(-)
MDETSDNEHDSDGNIGPFFYAIVGESQLFDKALMDNEVGDPNISILPVCSKNTISTNDSKHDAGDLNNFLQSEDVEPMKVALLKAELRKRGISTVGNTPILKKRLLDAIASNVTIRAVTDAQIYPNPQDGFSPTTHWVELVQKKTPVPNPTQEGFCAPTNRLVRDENKMYEFDEQFERPVFCEEYFECELTKHGRSYWTNG